MCQSKRNFIDIIHVIIYIHKMFNGRYGLLQARSKQSPICVWTDWVSGGTRVSSQVYTENSQIRNDGHAKLQQLRPARRHPAHRQPGLSRLQSAAARRHWWRCCACTIFVCCEPLAWGCNELNQFWSVQVGSFVLNKWPILTKTTQLDSKTAHTVHVYEIKMMFWEMDLKQISWNITYFLTPKICPFNFCFPHYPYKYFINV